MGNALSFLSRVRTARLVFALATLIGLCMAEAATLSISPIPVGGRVTSTPGSIDCGGNPSPGAVCSNNFTAGTSVTLTATADTGYRFVNWTGALGTTTTNPLTAPMPSTNTALTANFVAKTAQTISFPVIPAKVWSDPPFVITATATSGLTVTFSVIPTSVCTLVGNTVTLTGVSGTCTIAADQAGDATFASAPQVVQAIAVNRLNQTISFSLPATKLVNDAAFAITATTTSNLAVTFSIVPPSVCTLSGSTVTLTGAQGVCSIAADQAGDGQYNAAPQVNQTITVNKLGQSITFTLPATKLVNDAAFAITATATSGLPVTFSVVLPSVCTLLGSTVTLTGVQGTCSIAANQVGDGQYNPAPQVTASITVNKLGQSIIFNAVPVVNVNGTGTVSATATSGLPITYSVPVTTSVCSVNASSGVVTGTTVGTCTVAADQAGNGTYNAAATQSITFTINVAPISLTAVQSRKSHGGAGTFNLPIDTTQNIGGAVTVEPRAIGAGHTLVFQFDGPISGTPSAAVVDENGVPVGTTTVTVAGNDVVVTIAAVPDNKRVRVLLTNVNGAADFSTSLGFLVGDVNSSRAVSTSDIPQLKARSAQVVDATNFRFDLNTTGAIGSAEISAVKARAGNSLPTVLTNTLVTGTTGLGKVTSAPAGIDCSGACMNNFASGTTLTLTATPTSVSVFSGWGGACSGTGTCIVTMDSAKAVTASFALNCGTTCFVAPYAANGSLPPSPISGKVALSWQLQKVDVGFIMDTTGSMGGSISNFKASLSSTIIPALQTQIPSLGIGVAAHDDFPYAAYGTSGDLPFYSPAGGFVTTVFSDAQAAANALTTHGGNDAAESQEPAIYHALTGAGLTWPSGSVAAASPPAGTFGAMRFRSDALPVVINITDVGHHNGKRALDKTGTSYDAALLDAYSFPTYNVDDVVTKVNLLGAKFIGVSADNGTRGMGVFDPYGYHAYITDKTNSNVPPSAFTGGTCNTGANGAAVAADGPVVNGVQQCRSVYSISTAGTGLSTAVVNGVSAVVGAAKFDIHIQAYNDAAETTDVVGNFIQRIEPDPSGGTDPVTSATCVTFSAAQLSDHFTGPKTLSAVADGVVDTINLASPGLSYCFKVIPKANTTVAATAVQQTFRAWLRVVAVKPSGGTFIVGQDRPVDFIVPAAGS